MNAPTPKTPADLRKFGFVMAVPLSLLGALAWWRQGVAWPYLVAAAAAFAGLGLVAPSVLRPIESVWMKFAEALGTVMTFLVLVITFFVVFTPMGVVMRWLGRRPIAIAPDATQASYWEPIEAESAYARPDKPY